MPKLMITLKQWLEILLDDDDEAIKEILVWYNGWKGFLVEKNGSMLDVNKVEEVFYLMMLMID